MASTQSRAVHMPIRRTLLTSMLIAFGPSALAAGSFSGPGGIEGRWAMEVSVGASMRTREADKALIGIGNGGTASSNTVDDGNLNFKKGDVFSTVLKAVGEVELTKDNFGAFVRARAFSDQTLKSKRMPHGTSANAYRPNEKFDDQGYEEGSQFESVELLDSYVYGNFKPFGKDLSIRMGNQVVTWGESLFILGGINQYSNFDSAALRRPGAQLKEVFLPIPQIHASFQATESLSVESFIHLNHEKVVVDGCGTFFSNADLLNCNFSGSPINPGFFPLGPVELDFTNYNDQQSVNGGGTIGVNGQPVNSGSVAGLSPITGLLAGVTGLPLDFSKINFRMAQLQDRRPSDGGQFGLSGRFFASELDAEFGAYLVNYHQRVPAISLVKTPSNIEGSLFNGLSVGGMSVSNPASYFFDYGKKNIQVAGLSASSNLAGYAVFGEVSYTKGIPAAFNTVDLFKGATGSTGPLARYGNNEAFPMGSILQGFKPLDKIQMQASTIKSFPRILGAASVAVIGEAGLQIWKGIGDPFTGDRFGRSPAFGAAAHSAFNGGACPKTLNPNPENCVVDGYATKTAMGYRLLSVFNYPDAILGKTITPRVFFSHDFKGTSADGVFLEDRMNLGLGMRVDIQTGKYYADLSYSKFNSKARFDPMRDRDFMSVVFGASL